MPKIAAVPTPQESIDAALRIVDEIADGYGRAAGAKAARGIARDTRFLYEHGTLPAAEALPKIAALEEEAERLDPETPHRIAAAYRQGVQDGASGENDGKGYPSRYTGAEGAAYTQGWTRGRRQRLEQTS